MPRGERQRLRRMGRAAETCWGAADGDRVVYEACDLLPEPRLDLREGEAAGRDGLEHERGRKHGRAKVVHAL